MGDKREDAENRRVLNAVADRALKGQRSSPDMIRKASAQMQRKSERTGRK